MWDHAPLYSSHEPFSVTAVVQVLPVALTHDRRGGYMAEPPDLSKLSQYVCTWPKASSLGPSYPSHLSLHLWEEWKHSLGTSVSACLQSQRFRGDGKCKVSLGHIGKKKELKIIFLLRTLPASDGLKGWHITPLVVEKHPAWSAWTREDLSVHVFWPWWLGSSAISFWCKGLQGSRCTFWRRLLSLHGQEAVWEPEEETRQWICLWKPYP